jgi:hypothetical protein
MVVWAILEIWVGSRKGMTDGEYEYEGNFVFVTTAELSNARPAVTPSGVRAKGSQSIAVGRPTPPPIDIVIFPPLMDPDRMRYTGEITMGLTRDRIPRNTTSAVLYVRRRELQASANPGKSPGDVLSWIRLCNDFSDSLWLVFDVSRDDQTRARREGWNTIKETAMKTWKTTV